MAGMMDRRAAHYVMDNWPAIYMPASVSAVLGIGLLTSDIKAQCCTDRGEVVNNVMHTTPQPWIHWGGGGMLSS